MSKYQDRDLGMHRDITRRDFVNGVGAAVGGAQVRCAHVDATLTPTNSRV